MIWIIDLLSVDQTQGKSLLKAPTPQLKTQNREYQRTAAVFYCAHLETMCSKDETWHRGFLADVKTFFSLGTCFPSA